MGLNTFLIIINIIACTILLGVGTVVLVKNPKLSVNRYFFAALVIGVLWVLSNYFSNLNSLPYTQSLWANRAVFVFSYLLCLSLLLFATEFIGLTIRGRRLIFLTLGSIIAVILALSDMVVSSVHAQGNVIAINFGVLSPIFFGLLLGVLFYTFYLLGHAIRNSTGLYRQQIEVLSWSIGLGTGVALIFNFIFPAIFGTFQLTQMGFVSMVLFTGGMTYAIIRQKAFDIGVVVFRALGYILTVGAMIVVSSIIVLQVLNFIGLETTTFQKLVLFLCIVFLGLAYQPSKGIFDKLTARIFYRDVYDAQLIYDELNRHLVSSLDLSFVLNNSAKIIAKGIRAEYCSIGLRDNKGQERVFGTKRIDIDQKSLNRHLPTTLRQSTNVLVADYLDQSNSGWLKEFMVNNSLAVIVVLANANHDNSGSMGYIFLGNKNSGSPYNKDDVRTLEAIANELVLAIQNALRFEEIQNFAATLQGRVDEATKKLRKANEKLKEMDETKDDFISMASHQLRTPLTSMKGYVSMVLEGDAGKISAQQKEMLSQAYFSSQRMVYLIADLLNVSRLKTGKFIIEPASINLATIIDQELNQLQETAASRNLKLNYVRPKDFPNVMLDETKTRQVIMNFVDNAIYYTPSGGHVTVRLTETPTTIELRVEDDGIGVAKSDQPHLFTKFYRAGNARKARPDGTGLGLFMAKKVIMAEGGTLIFESTEGKGSTFGFIFSKAKVGLDASGGTIVEHTPVVEPK